MLRISRVTFSSVHIVEEWPCQGKCSLCYFINDART